MVERKQKQKLLESQWAADGLRDVVLVGLDFLVQNRRLPQLGRGTAAVHENGHHVRVDHQHRVGFGAGVGIEPLRNDFYK